MNPTERHGPRPHAPLAGLGRLGILFVFAAAAVLILSASRGRAESADWLQIPTRNAGLLSLPPQWSVVSQDEPAELYVTSGTMLHVQQVLYANSSEAALDGAALNEAVLNGAALQIFSIWSTDRDELVLPFSGGIPAPGGDVVAALIGSRFGNVTKLADDFAETGLEVLPVAAYDVDVPGLGGSKLRYKLASLFCGEKQVLALIHYLPEHEDYWHSQFETLLDAWVTSLALTSQPGPEMPVASIPMPAAPNLPDMPDFPEVLPQAQPIQPLPAAEIQRELPALTSPPSAAKPAAPQQAAGQPADSMFFYAGGLLAFALLFALFACVRKKIAGERQPARKRGSPARRAAFAGPADTQSTQSVRDTLDVQDTLNGLEESFGSSYVIDRMRDEILKVLESGQKSPRANEKPERFIMKLCCDCLAAMLRSGRYHIGKGILSHDGQEIVDLFEHIHDIRLSRAYSSPEEAAKDASFIQFCVRSSG